MSAIWSIIKKVNAITVFIKKSVNRLTYFLYFSVGLVNDIITEEYIQVQIVKVSTVEYEGNVTVNL